MKYVLLEGSSSKGLNLFFTGWGMDVLPFVGDRSALWKYVDRSLDTAMVYDYSDLEFKQEWIADYQEIRLIAWSMGVWAAEQVFIDNVISALSINGTGVPIDNDRGIRVDVFEGTVAQLDEQNLLKFYRRMCGSNDCFSQFLIDRPKRSIQSLCDELIAIELQSRFRSPHLKRWSEALIGGKDLIFRSENQIRYWTERGVPITLTPQPHFL